MPLSALMFVRALCALPGSSPATADVTGNGVPGLERRRCGTPVCRFFPRPSAAVVLPQGGSRHHASAASFWPHSSYRRPNMAVPGLLCHLQLNPRLLRQPTVTLSFKVTGTCLEPSARRPSFSDRWEGSEWRNSPYLDKSGWELRTEPPASLGRQPRPPEKNELPYAQITKQKNRNSAG